jgi:hypothetical protein
MSSAEKPVDAGTNIKNAFSVVGQSYKNVHKFLAELNAMASEEGFVPLLDRFLRWRSNREWEGWLIWSFISLLQKKDDPAHGTVAGLRQGSIYCVEVSFEMETNPALYLSRFDYDPPDLNTWTGLPAVRDHWAYFYPVRPSQAFQVTKLAENTSVSRPDTKTKAKYWGLDKVIFTRTELVSVDDQAKIRSNVFQVLKKLPDGRPSA